MNFRHIGDIADLVWPWLRRYWWTGPLLVFICNLFIDIMEVDASQYAMISMEMLQTGSYLQVYEQGYDYLDKPPLLFWLSSASMAVFGVNNFAYKFPSFLFALLAIFSTYKFTMVYYSRQTSLLAALVLATSQAMFMITNDVRTDTILMGATAFSFWRIAVYLRKRTINNLLLISIGIGAGMLVKGPVALVYPVLAFGFEFLSKRQWKNILNPHWLIAAAGIAVILLPMCYGLYMQFDMHPDKIVYDLKGPSGLRFYFWTQSFGRITGEIYWKNNAGFLFFVQSILWDFQPWVLFLIPALAHRLFRLIRQGITASPENITLGGFCLMFFAFSLSSYKLPHYIFILFPAAAVMTADFMVRASERFLKPLSYLHLATMTLLYVLMVTGLQWFFPFKNGAVNWVFTLLVFGCYIGLITLWRFLQGSGRRIITAAAVTAVLFNLFMALHFYPNLLKYQAPANAARYLISQKADVKSVCKYEARSSAMDFYFGNIIPNLNPEDIFPKAGTHFWIYTDEICRQDLLDKGLKPLQEVVFKGYSVSLVSLPFLDPSTRESRLKRYYLLLI